MNATVIHVVMEPHASMELTSTRVNVCLDTLEFIVKLISMNVHQIHVQMEEFVLTKSMDSDVNVLVGIMMQGA